MRRLVLYVYKIRTDGTTRYDAYFGVVSCSRFIYETRNMTLGIKYY